MQVTQPGDMLYYHTLLKTLAYHVNGAEIPEQVRHLRLKKRSIATLLASRKELCNTNHGPPSPPWISPRNEYVAHGACSRESWVFTTL
eukprot:8401915-Pyramimonas_sp.AAC.1